MGLDITAYKNCDWEAAFEMAKEDGAVKFW